MATSSPWDLDLDLRRLHECRSTQVPYQRVQELWNPWRRENGTHLLPLYVVLRIHHHEILNRITITYFESIHPILRVLIVFRSSISPSFENPRSRKSSETH